LAKLDYWIYILAIDCNKIGVGVKRLVIWAKVKNGLSVSGPLVFIYGRNANEPIIGVQAQEKAHLLEIMGSWSF
jgi:hypothetical protein